MAHKSSSFLQQLLTGVVIAVLVVVAISFVRGGGKAGPIALGKSAPALRIRLANGMDTTLNQYRGRVVVLNFWASYCGPCRKEIPELDQVYERFKNNVEMIGISVEQGSLSELQDAAATLGITYPVGVAHPDDVTQYNVRVIPTTLVIDPSGQVTFSRIGQISQEELESAIEAASQKGSA